MMLYVHILVIELILDLFKANIEMHIYFRTKGDGNCMYRACSKLLCGRGDLHGILRDLTSIELFKNQEFYAFHLYLMQKSHLFASENTAFSATASDGALADGFDRSNLSSRAAVVKREAPRNAVSGTFSSLLCMFALSRAVARALIGRPVIKLKPMYCIPTLIVKIVYIDFIT